MHRLFAAFLISIVGLLRPALAQEAAWVQIEAHPSLITARERASAFAGNLADVNGFALGGGWYGIALGPYTRPDAERVLRIYRLQGQIPQDAYVVGSENFGQQFWPVGDNVLNDGAAPAQPAQAQAETVQATAPAPEPMPADETPAQARRSEQALDAGARRALQVALKAAGFYASTIDGAFGRGTRAAMSDWQAARGYEPTGVLTTRQRQALMDEYNAPLISVGMRDRTDSRAGIAMQMPMGAVAFSRYESPFAHYDATGDLDVRVLLISQPGDQATLYGLYDIMQTLEIVPLEGPRSRDGNSFTLEGRGRGIVSHTEATLKGGEIKGFTLIWPAGDEDRRRRVLTEMQASFQRLEGVLDPAAGADAPQNVDLISGLTVRKPKRSRSGFYIDAAGMVLTTAEAVEGCTRITLDHDYPAQVAALDADRGLAVLRPEVPLAPMTVARLRAGEPRLQSDVAVSGYSYGGVLGAPTLTFGAVADLKGLGGEPELTRLALAPLPGDAGGPVLDTAGGVIGLLLPRGKGGQRLPEDVSFAADTGSIRAMLGAAGVQIDEEIASGAPLPPDDLSKLALGMTVLVGCWD
ncbi:serine protease [Antarcticimicrobium luteum]|uniref:Peptidoglycan-binding protein n=1 Tax=Antarcticimicrobium luteum TaxID=2547397 RepID=A0A4R5UVD8_9RHOB|nr:serine protease [Antarcticimicrobium luteum]TDK43193.1 peptidoglycan-binding protein [Antarcticimicrobium luteum]